MNYRALLPLVMIALVGVVIWQNQLHQPAPPPRADCANLAKGCAAPLGGRTVEYGLDAGAESELKALKPFQVWVKAPGAKQVEARFNMAEMDMGINLYTLRPDAQGVFRASVTLPVCMSGSSDWIVALSVDGAELQAPFTLGK